MNTVTPEKKAGIFKALAILGFFAIIGFIVWASVQIVAYAPRGFTSLASLAASLSHYQDSLSLDDTTLALTNVIEKTETGKPMVISWTKQPQTGNYSFNYVCSDGISIDVVDTEGLRSITCNTNYSLGDTDTVTIIVDSKNQNETSVKYSIAYTDENKIGPTHTSEQTVLVFASAPANNGQVLGQNDNTDWKDSISVPKPKPTPDTNTTVLVPKPEVTGVPVSDPKGFADLSTVFIATGVISGNTFKATSIKQNNEGAFQFAVTNLGTKTSESWSYMVTLPGGNIYTSPLQTPLLPGEKATIAIGFSTDNDHVYNSVVVVIEKSDINLKNNSLTQKINLVK